MGVLAVPPAILMTPSPLMFITDWPERVKAPCKERFLPEGTFHVCTVKSGMVTLFDMVKSAVAPDMSMPPAPNVRVLPPVFVIIVTGPAGFKILMPPQDALAPRMSVALFGSVMVLSHWAMSAAPGTALFVQEVARFKASVLLTLTNWPACASGTPASNASVSPARTEALPAGIEAGIFVFMIKFEHTSWAKRVGKFFWIGTMG